MSNRSSEVGVSVNIKRTFETIIKIQQIGRRMSNICFLALFVLIIPLKTWALPTVTIKQLDLGFVSSERGPSPGIFEFTRTVSSTSELNAELVVNFTLTGTAQRNLDYLSWETAARFSPGNTKAWVTIMPRNDTLQEPPETVIATLAPGAGYTVGTTSSATITVLSLESTQGFIYRSSGIHDLPSLCYPGDVSGFCTPVLSKDIEFLDAWIEPYQGIPSLWVDVGIKTLNDMVNLAIYLDTDQNPLTGDVRPGFQGGAEFRINGSVTSGLLALAELKKLPTNPVLPDIFALINQQPNELYLGNGAAGWITSGTFTNRRGLYRTAIPLSAIGNPTAVDVTVSTFANGGGGLSKVAGDGDRAPDFGAFATDSGHVVVRRPGVSQLAFVSDTLNDKPVGATGFSLADVAYQVIADQFFINIGFEQSFDSRFIGADILSTEITFDGDRNLGTGGIAMGNGSSSRIPSWGGDTKMIFQLAAGAPTTELQFDPIAVKVNFGGDFPNDGRWLSLAFAGLPNRLQLTGSLSLLDSFTYKHIINSNLTEQDLVTRNKSNGSANFQLKTRGVINTINGSSEIFADQLPNNDNAISTLAGKTIKPLAFNNPPFFAKLDPAEGFGGLSGLDINAVIADLVGNNFVFYGRLTSLLSTQTGLIYSIFLDTDINSATGAPVKRQFSPNTILGAEFKLEIVVSDGGLASTTTVKLVRCPQGDSLCRGPFTLHESLVDIRPSPTNPPYFMATIPLQILRNAGATLGSTVRFVLATGQDLGVDQIDIAPDTAAILPATPRPDLLITSITTNPASPSQNGSFSITVNIKNQGTAPSGANTLSIWTNQTANQSCGAVGNKTVSVGALAPGGSTVLTVSGLSVGTIGNKTLRAFVDRACVINEVREDNNQKIVAYTVS